MTDDGDAANDPQKTANLARIRDNQRRSRARRKDYLTDLESKYRNCEQVGVAASVEIQTAAKNVLEENRRLRNLLKAYGIPDAEIDGVSGQQGSLAADTLVITVNSRRPCGQGSECQSGPRTTESSCQAQPASCGPTQTQSALPPNVVPRPAQETQPNAPAQQYMGQIPSPVSLNGPEHPFTAAPAPTIPNGAIHNSQPYDVPSSEHFAFSNGFHEYVMNHNMPRTSPRNDGYSSCQIAADSIRTFSPEAGYELEKQLGCRVLGQDCAVPNMKLFNVIDSYTGGSC